MITQSRSLLSAAAGGSLAVALSAPSGESREFDHLPLPVLRLLRDALERRRLRILRRSGELPPLARDSYRATTVAGPLQKPLSRDLLQFGIQYQLQKLTEVASRYGHGWSEWKTEAWAQRLASRLMRVHEGRANASL